MTVIVETKHLTWDAYMEIPGDMVGMRPVQALENIANHWVHEGYRHLASLGGQPLKSDSPATIETRGDPSSNRKSFIVPLLEAKGMSRSKWASLARVDPSVVYDYLNGESEPRPDSRKALADVLGIKPSDFPK